MTVAAARWLVLLLGFAVAMPSHAQAALAGCSQETLPVRGVPVTIVYCITGPPHYESDEIVVPISASYTAPSGSFGRQRELRFVSGEGAPRILENVPLARLGMAGVLHLTLVYATGQVLVEGALLTPGGITIK